MLEQQSKNISKPYIKVESSEMETCQQAELDEPRVSKFPAEAGESMTSVMSYPGRGGGEGVRFSGHTPVRGRIGRAVWRTLSRGGRGSTERTLAQFPEASACWLAPTTQKHLVTPHVFCSALQIFKMHTVVEI
jgi:hypothetical protein